MILLLALGAILLAPFPAYSAITCGDVTSVITATGASSVTVSYTTPSGTNQVLHVAVGNRDVTDTVSTVTHAGNAMAEKIELHHSSQVANAALYHLAAPTSGTNDVVVTFTGATLAHGVAIFTCSDASQDADPYRNAGNSAEGNSTTPSVTITDGDGTDLVIDVMAVDSNAAGPTVGADQTSLFSGSDGTELGMGVSTQPASANGVMSWTVTSNDWVIAGVSLKELISDLFGLKKRRVYQ